MTVLYLGQLFNGSTALHRLRAIERLGHEVIKINTLPKQDIFSRGINKLFVRIFGFRFEDIKLNIEVIKTAKNIPEIDCLWVDKGLRISPDTLHKLKQQFPAMVLIHYSPDDMLNRSNQTKFYLSSIPLYHFHVTTKSYNLQELKALGASDVLFVNNAFDPLVHRLVELNKNELKYYGAEVSFIGSYEIDRARSIEYICRKGIEVKVWGRSWKKKMVSTPNLKIIEKDMLEDEYTKVLNATSINLCFLRKVNRDLQTTRSIEIPASGGFMLGERTAEHLNLFLEGVEAEYFSSDEELYQKVIFYRSNPELLKKIAENGHKKCLVAGYSNDDRIVEILKHADLSVDNLQ